MSWLAQGLTNSVTGKISQISGQLKEILTETTDDDVDPIVQTKVLNDRLKEMEKHIATLNMECTRWKDESNELSIKCSTYESQLVQRQSEFKQQLVLKESEISELRNQLDATKHENLSPPYTQKSSLMEEFEEIMPSSELNDYIQHQKEMKRLKEDNKHLSSENKELSSRVKSLEASLASLEQYEKLQSLDQSVVEKFEQEINSLKRQLESQKDKHQAEVVGIQQEYNYKQKQQTNVYEKEIEELKEKLNKAENELLASSQNVAENNPEPESRNMSSKKSDEGWCLNGEEINLKDSNTESQALLEEKMAQRDNEIEQLKIQVETLEADLEAANQIVQKLKSSSRASSESPGETPPKSGREEQALAAVEAEKEHIQRSLEEAHAEINELKASLERQTQSNQTVLKEKESRINSIQAELEAVHLELKQHHQSMQQEKMLQVQALRQNEIEFDKLKNENVELHKKLDEKLSEIKNLGDQINDLNANLNTLRSNDSSLSVELETKTEQFVEQLDKANVEIAALKQERDELVELKKQFEFLIDEKTRETSALRVEVQNHVHHIAAQGQALEKLQEDLKQKQKSDSQTEQASNELNELKLRYNELYSYLEKKNEESSSYYNEIQRLNGILSEHNKDLNNLKTMNVSLTEQYENLSREFQLEQKMVEDLNQQIYDLNNSLIDTTEAFRQQSPERSASVATLVSAKVDAEVQTLVFETTKIEEEATAVDVEEREEKMKQIEEHHNAAVKLLEQQIEALQREKIQLVDENQRAAAEMMSRIQETQVYYENLFRKEMENFQNKLASEEQQKAKIVRELDRLKEHLMVISENSNSEALQAENREKELRTLLAEKEAALQKQGSYLEVSSKEMETRVLQLIQQNQDLVDTREKLKDRLKQAEESLGHQVKITKNLELVLERLQQEKDSQHSLELEKYQQTIKDQAKTIHRLQSECETYLNKINELKKFSDKFEQSSIEVIRKDELIKNLKDQISTKDALIESLDKRVNETTKINENFIDKEMIKNLIIGYIKVVQPQEKKQVLKLIATMLNFSPSEIELVESSSSSSETKWFGLLKTPFAKNSPSKSPDTPGSSSFAELLIEYVDRESKPKNKLKFDLNDPALAAKKSDTPDLAPSLLLNERGLDFNTSESAITFFNNSISGNELKLLNRTGNVPTSPSQPQSQNVTSSPSTADTNSILEQILK